MAKPKLSPALIPFLTRAGSKKRRSAIVVYQAPKNGKLISPTDSATQSQLRDEYLDVYARLQLKAGQKAMESYARKAKTYFSGKAPEIHNIGSGILPVFSVEVTRQSLQTLANQPEVIAILPNQNAHLIEPKMHNTGSLSRSESSNGMSWGLTRLGVEKMWEFSQGEGVTIGVLDTGVFGSHPSLKDRIRDFTIIDPLGRQVGVLESFDAGTHGTHVCGTIAGNAVEGIRIGVAPHADIVVAAVLLGQATVSTIVEGISWAVEKGADIINLSLGLEYYEPMFSEILLPLTDTYGVLPVIAIGNGNHGSTCCPGNVVSAFSVGALQKAGSRGVEVAPFSGGASLEFHDTIPRKLVTKPDISAPGVDILSCIPPYWTDQGMHSYCYSSGTSMATPHVSGVAALLMSAKPGAVASEIKDALCYTAKHPYGTERRPGNRWGFGEIQPKAALDHLLKGSVIP